MSYIFNGKLSGLICPDCPSPLWGKIKIYRASNVDPKELLLAASLETKFTFRFLKPEELKARENDFLGEAQLGPEGTFSVGFSRDYDGGPVEIVMCIQEGPRGLDYQPSQPVFFSITVMQPLWQDRKQNHLAYWEEELSNRFWCDILAKLGIWVICGRVCDPDCKAPVAGVRVRAFDKDCIQDDFLGEAITDHNGHFAIYYTEADFKKTIFPSWNVESGSGPDLYFIVDHPVTGSILLRENRLRGHKKDRKNVGHCFCVKLCLEKEPDGGGQEPTPKFTHVGKYKITTDFNAAGFAPDSGPLGTTVDLAFTDTIPLIGDMPGVNDPQDWEYRFVYEVVSSSVLSTSGPTPIGGNMIASTKIGYLEFYDNGPPITYPTEDYYLNNAAAPHNIVVPANGWIPVPTNDDRYTVGLFSKNEQLARLNTTVLINEFFNMVSPSLYKAGDPIPAAVKTGTHVIRITFQARPVGTIPIVFQNTLQRIVISNTGFKQQRHPYWAGDEPTMEAICMLDIEEMNPGTSGGTGCNAIEDTLTVNYSAFQPHAGHLDMWIKGNGISTATYKVSPAIDATGEATGQHLYNLSALPPCAYILKLRLYLHLSHGWGWENDHTLWDEIAFCVKEEK